MSAASSCRSRVGSLASITLSALLLHACGDDAPPPAPGVPPATPATPAPPTPTPTTPTPGQPPGGAATLIAALDATTSVPHRMRATVTGATEGSGVFIVEVQPPDRMHATIEIAPGRSIETIAIGNEMWTNAMGGRFTRMPGGASPTGQLSEGTARIRAALADGTARFRVVGPETLDGQPMTVWESEGPMSLDPSDPASPTGTGRVWIGADGRIHRARTEGMVRGSSVVVDIRYENDPSIRIEPPGGEAAAPPARVPRGARVLHPLSPGMPGCLEMYTACRPGPGNPECTSAPFNLACGESGRVPNGGDLVFCACP